jgi:transcriptional regulator with GAF, ATPase, and Fis domain
VVQLQNLDEGEAADGGGAQLVSGAPVPGSRRQMAANFQLNVDNVAKIVCPHCSRPSENIGLALNLTVGPVPEGVQVLMVRPGATMRTVVDDVRRALINDALNRANGNQARAAKLLGMKYTTFHTLSRRLGIERAKKRRFDVGRASDEGVDES